MFIFWQLMGVHYLNTFSTCLCVFGARGGLGRLIMLYPPAGGLFARSTARELRKHVPPADRIYISFGLGVTVFLAHDPTPPHPLKPYESHLTWAISYILVLSYTSIRGEGPTRYLSPFIRPGGPGA